VETLNKYSILTILNSSYFKFGKIFLNSLFEKLYTSKLDYVFVADTGLSQKERDYLQSFTKVILIKTGHKTKGYVKTWDSNWVDNVSLKTKILQKILDTYEHSVVMIDADCMFLKDFTDIIDFKYDIQATYRGENHKTPYVASFLSINKNNKETKGFVEKWINEIENWESVPKESPALSKVCSNENYNVGKISDKVISATGPIADIEEWDSYIVHFKSSRPPQDTPEQEFDYRTYERGYGKLVDRYLNV